MRRRCRAIYAERLTPLLLVVGAACSDDEAAPGNVVVREGMATAGGTATAGGAGGTATAGGAGGTATAGGAGGMAMAGGAGGMAMAGGAGGMSMGGAGLAGAGGGRVGPPVVCDPEAPQSPSNGVVCTETCTDPCGLHALGNRVCECGEASADEPCDDPGVTVCFDCKTCLGVEDHPLYVPLDEAPLEDCPLADSELEDQKDCVENERCQSIREGGENRFCGCLGGEWDCDSKPSFLRD